MRRWLGRLLGGLLSCGGEHGRMLWYGEKVDIVRNSSSKRNSRHATANPLSLSWKQVTDCTGNALSDLILWTKFTFEGKSLECYMRWALKISHLLLVVLLLTIFSALYVLSRACRSCTTSLFWNSTFIWHGLCIAFHLHISCDLVSWSQSKCSFCYADQ